MQEHYQAPDLGIIGSFSRKEQEDKMLIMAYHLWDLKEEILTHTPKHLNVVNS